MIYFDNAKTSRPEPEMINIIKNDVMDFYGSTSPIHSFSQKIKAKIEEARKNISYLINVFPHNLYFTSGGTEANNIAIRGAIEANNIKTVICSPLEHLSIIKPFQQLEKQNKIQIIYLKLDKFNNPKLDKLENVLSENENSLLSISHSNHLTGNILPIKKIGKLCKKHNAIFHCDMAQTMGYLDLDFQKIDVDIATASAHKFHGFAGVGLIYIADKVKVIPIVWGENNEYGMRAGTENFIGIISMSEALKIAYVDIKKHQQKIISNTIYLKSKLSENIPNITFNTDIRKDKIHKILNVTFDKIKSSELFVMKLDIKGIAVSKGNFIDNNIDKSIRFSLSKFNEKSEIDYCVKTIFDIIVSENNV